MSTIKLFGGSPIPLYALQMNDMFWMKFGSYWKKFRVHLIVKDTGVFVHALDWSKNDGILIPFDSTDECYYAGKMSTFRSWFLL